MWLTETEVAQMVKVSKKTIRRLIQAGKLPAANWGTGKRSNYRIHVDDVAAFGRRDQADDPRPARIRRRHRPPLPTSVEAYLPRVA